MYLSTKFHGVTPENVIIFMVRNWEFQVSHELLPLCQKTDCPLAALLSTIVWVPTTISILAVGFIHRSTQWAHWSHFMDSKQQHTNLVNGQWRLPPGIEHSEHEPHHLTQSEYEWKELYHNLPCSPQLFGMVLVPRNTFMFLTWCVC